MVPQTQTIAKSSVASVMMTPMYGPGLKSLDCCTGGAYSPLSRVASVVVVVDSVSYPVVVDDVDCRVVLVGRL